MQLRRLSRHACCIRADVQQGRPCVCEGGIEELHASLFMQCFVATKLGHCERLSEKGTLQRRWQQRVLLLLRTANVPRCWSGRQEWAWLSSPTLRHAGAVPCSTCVVSGKRKTHRRKHVPRMAWLRRKKLTTSSGAVAATTTAPRANWESVTISQPTDPPAEFGAFVVAAAVASSAADCQRTRDGRTGSMLVSEITERR
jgi:hypothetical protein